MEESLWKPARQFLLKLHIFHVTQQFSSWAFIPDKFKTYGPTKTSAEMLMILLFIIAKTGNNADVFQYLNRLWYIHTCNISQQETYENID